MQNIYIATGDPVTASAIQNILQGLAVPAILSGMELSAPSSDQIAVSPGSALTDAGVIIAESEIKTVQFTQSVQPQNYTIYYSYTPSTNFGGNPAVLTLVTGLLPSSTFSGGVLIGWIKYPGGSVALSTSMFISAKRIKLDAPADQQPGVFRTDYAPFSYKLTRVTATGSFPVLTETYDGTQHAPLTTIQNNGSGISNSVYIMPFQIAPEGLGKIQIELAVSSQASCTISVMKSDGTIVSPLETNFVTDVPMETVTLSFDQSNDFISGDVCYVQFVLAIQPSNSVTLKAVGSSADTEPF